MTTELLPVGVRGRQIRLEYVDGVLVGHGLKGQVVQARGAVAVTRFDYTEFHSAARGGGQWVRVKGLAVLDAQQRILLIAYADFDPRQTAAFTAAAGLQPGPDLDLPAAKDWLKQRTTPETQRLKVHSALVGGTTCVMAALAVPVALGGIPLLYWLAPGLSVGVFFIPVFGWMLVMIAVIKGAKVLAHRRGEA